MIEILSAVQPVVQSHSVRLVQLSENWELIFFRGNKTHKLEITSGFLFDGASIPRLCWSLLGIAPHGVMDGPSLPHDAGYELQGAFTVGSSAEAKPATLSGDSKTVFTVYDSELKQWQLCTENMTKAELDELLYKLCQHFKVRRVLSTLIWSAVSAFGWLAWRRDDKTRKKQQQKVSK